MTGGSGRVLGPGPVSWTLTPHLSGWERHCGQALCPRHPSTPTWLAPCAFLHTCIFIPKITAACICSAPFQVFFPSCVTLWRSWWPHHVSALVDMILLASPLGESGGFPTHDRQETRSFMMWVSHIMLNICGLWHWADISD